MKVTKLAVYANCDMATIARITDAPIKDCADLRSSAM